MGSREPRAGDLAASRFRDVSVEAVLEAAPNAIVAVDGHGRIVYANPVAESSFGYSRDGLVGRPIETLLPEPLRRRHATQRRAFLDAPVARPMGIGMDLTARRRDGTTFPVEISLAPVESSEGLRVVATIVDVTARQAAEAQLLQGQKLESIGRLAGGIAHDFNNMMFAVRGYADLLREDLDPEHSAPDLAQARQFVDALDHAAERAAGMTAQLLAFSRRQVVLPHVIDLNDAVARVEPMVGPLIGEHIRLKTRLGSDAGRIHMDPGQLDQIVVNLVVNARDALSAGGTITIETGSAIFDEAYAVSRFQLQPGAYAMLSVADDGVGMTPDTLERMFEPFFTTKEAGHGTGLGLSTIHGIVRQAGGHIWVYSEPGRGSVFKLYFPSILDAADDAEPVPAADWRGGGRVLIVEDDPVVRDMTVRVFERAGSEVVVADASGALDAVLADPAIDTLITDVVMPTVSGIDLATELVRRRPSIAIVLLSGYIEESLELRPLLDRGAVFVAKPATTAQLLSAVAQARQGTRSA